MGKLALVARMLATPLFTLALVAAADPAALAPDLMREQNKATFLAPLPTPRAQEAIADLERMLAFGRADLNVSTVYEYANPSARPLRFRLLNVAGEGLNEVFVHLVHPDGRTELQVLSLGGRTDCSLPPGGSARFCVGLCDDEAQASRVFEVRHPGGRRETCALRFRRF